MTPVPLLALAAAIAAAAGVGALAVAFTPRRVRTSGSESAGPLLERSSSAAVAIAIVVTFVVLLATGWLVLALAAGGLVVGWRWLFVVDDAKVERARVQAIAKWLEDLRDVIRRSSVPPEEALELVAESATGELREPLTRFVLRRRQGVPLETALTELADAIEHPTADAAVASILLVVGGGAGGARLYDTVDELAEAARNELARREEIDRLRRVYQRAMRRLIAIVVVFVAALRFFAEAMVEPYSEPVGQVWLVLPVSIWIGCLVWMRRLTRYDLGARYRLRRAATGVAGR